MCPTVTHFDRGRYLINQTRCTWCNFYFIQQIIVTISPSSTPSFTRTLFFIEIKYGPSFVGKSDVCHSLAPSCARTGTNPNPTRFPGHALTAADCTLSTYTKCHPARPGYRHTFPFTIIRFFTQRPFISLHRHQDPYQLCIVQSLPDISLLCNQRRTFLQQHRRRTSCTPKPLHTPH